MALIELRPDRRAFITDLAEDVWRTYSRERQVFLDGVAEAVDVSLSYGEYGDAFDGLVEHRSAFFHIYCNTARGQPYGSPRARFTVAHELGHFFIDEHRNALAAGNPPHCSFTENPSDNPAEAEANHFAAHLLMPTQEFQAALAEVPAGLEGIIEIASTFRVSIQSAALRYAAASRRACAVVMFRNGGKPWWDISPELKTHGYQWIQKLSVEAIPGEAATALAMHDNASSLGSPHQSGTLASAWFSGVVQGSKQDEMFVESAMRLGSRGVITLLELHAMKLY